MSQSHIRPGLICLFLGLMPLAAPVSAQELIDCPTALPTPTISHQMFRDVCISGNPLNPILFFDDYSWRIFLALAWPARQGQRGQPDSSLPLGAPGRPTVFETFKAEWEVFQPNDRDRVGWNEYGGEDDNPCRIGHVGFGDVLLAAFSKFDNVVQAGAPQGALIAQNRTYVRHSSGFNERHFQHVLAGKYYLRNNLTSVVSFPVGAISVKSAWIDMQDVQRPDRFFTRNAWLFNLATETCEQKKVGLVGLHIVAKTPTRPQWIWSTFEHIDNVPPPEGSAPPQQPAGPFTFNTGDGTPMATEIPERAKCPHGQCPLPPPAPYNVERLKPIHDQGNFSTAKTNQKYRDLLAEQYPNSPWKNYQLVMTQWPVAASRPDLDGNPVNTFPGTELLPRDYSAFSNTTMETFKQLDVNQGCMGCHNRAKRVDFVFTLLTRAYPRDPSTLPAAHLKILEEVGKLVAIQEQK